MVLVYLDMRTKVDETVGGQEGITYPAGIYAGADYSDPALSGQGGPVVAA